MEQKHKANTFPFRVTAGNKQHRERGGGGGGGEEEAYQKSGRTGAGSERMEAGKTKRMNDRKGGGGELRYSAMARE